MIYAGSEEELLSSTIQQIGENTRPSTKGALWTFYGGVVPFW